MSASPDFEPRVNQLLRARVRPDVQAMQRYVVQDADGLVKLDAMENPHRLSPALQAELGQRLGAVALNRYPGPRTQRLRQALIDYAQVPAGYDVVLGNGSDELISLLALACARPEGACILAPEPGFVMYALSAQLQGLRYVGVALTDRFALDAPAMCAAIAQHRPALTYLAYPNNPTANLWDDTAMQAVIAAAAAVDGLVVIDEAYQPFAARHWGQRLTAWPNVLLLRTLSKFGLAGIRLGYLIAPSALSDAVDKVRPPYNVGVLHTEAALFALEHADVFAAQAQDVRAQRARLLSALAALPDVEVFPSEANMILIRVAAAAATFAALKAHGVLIKNVSTMHPLLANCLRLTVGTADENSQLLAALRASL